MKILVAIHGAHSQPDAMRAQRETWLRDLKGADYRYFLGHPQGSDEDAVYIDSPDGPIWQGPHRTWWLNRKTEALARYALEHGYDYVFKADDDTFVYPDRLLASGFEQHDYAGSMASHRAAGVGDYLWAQGGAGYWLSRRAMQIVADEGLTRVRSEDFAVGQLLAAHGIAAHHDERYCPAVQQGDCPKSDPVTLHKVSPAWMRALYRKPLTPDAFPNFFQSLARQYPLSH